MSVKIKRYLQTQYPDLASVLAQVKTIPRLRPSNMSLPEAVVRVITGQMLSSQTAGVIYGRMQVKAKANGLLGTWLLDHESLRACGLSRAKAQTVCDVGCSIGTNLNALDHWHRLSPEDLSEEIKRFRGMGDWSASIISLWHVGHEDIFPISDGSLRRAVAMIQSKIKGRKKLFDPNKAAPYRSYLALYLWRAIDTGVLAQNLEQRKAAYAV